MRSWWSRRDGSPAAGSLAAGAEPEVRQTPFSAGAPGRRGEPLPRAVRVLAVVAFCVAAGFGIAAPAIPVFARSFGVSRTEASAVVSVFAAARLLSAPLAGRLLNRFSERLVLLTGLLVVSASSAAAGFATAYPQLLFYRGLGGTGSAMFTTAATALLLRSVSPAARGRAQGAFSGGFLLGGVSGPALGGFVTAISPRAPFFVYAVTLGAAAAVAAVALPRARGVETEAGATAEEPARLRAALRLSAYRAVLATQFAQSWSSLGVRTALVPLLVTETLARSSTWTGVAFVAFSLANAASLTVAGRATDTAGRRPVLLAGTVVASVAAGLLAVPLGGVPGLVLLIGALAVAGAAGGLLSVAPAAVLGDVLGARRGGPLVATYSMAGDLGVMTGPLLAGALADTVGIRYGFALTALVLAGAALACRAAPETRPAPAGEGSPPMDSPLRDSPPIVVGSPPARP